MSQNALITCRELIEFLGEYTDKTLSPSQVYEFERHLKVCPSCVAYVEAYQQTIKLGKIALVPSDQPAPVPESLVRAIRAARETHRPSAS